MSHELIQGIFYLHNLLKWLIFISTFLILSGVSTAQTEDYRDTTGLEFPKFRNEIFLNITPAFVVGLAAESIEPRFSIGFQRHLKPNMSARVWLNYEIMDDIQEDSSNGRVIPTGLGTFDLRIRDNFDYRTDVRFGLSFSKPDARISAIYGADVFMGMRERVLETDFIPFEIDTTQCANCYRPSLTEAPETIKYEESYFITGLDFSVGALFKPGKRIWIVLQWTPEVNYTSLIDETFSDPTLRSRALTNGLNFDLRGVELFGGIRF